MESYSESPYSLGVSFDWLTDEKMHALNERKLALLREGKEVADLTMINPDLAPPRLLIDKLLELTVRGSNHRYAVARGIRRLREAFAHKYEDRFRVRIDPEREVCVTLGSKDGVEQVLRVLASEHAPGSVAPILLVGTPAYPHYRVAALLHGFRFIGVPLTETLDEFLKAAAQLPPRSVLMLNFPHNPTGMVMPEGGFERIAAIAQERDLIVINDFVYGELVYGSTPVHTAVHTAAPSLLSVVGLRDRAVEIYSLSKAYSIPGWRIGAVMGWPALVHQVALLKSYIDYGAFLPLQGAAAAALHAPQSLIAPIVDEYQRRARLLVSALEQAGWKVTMPVSGCAVWARLPGYRGSGYQLAEQLLEHAGIGAVPGERFYGYEGDEQIHIGAQPLKGTAVARAQEAHLRFALVVSEGALRLIGDRIARLTPQLLSTDRVSDVGVSSCDGLTRRADDGALSK